MANCRAKPGNVPYYILKAGVSAVAAEVGKKGSVRKKSRCRTQYIPDCAAAQSGWIYSFSMRQTAWADMPSQLPVNPSPSSVVAFTLTQPSEIPRASEIFALIRGMC